MQYNRDYNSSSKCAPCASDNSMSGCYESDSNRFNNDEINYGYVGVLGDEMFKKFKND